MSQRYSSADDPGGHYDCAVSVRNPLTFDRNISLFLYINLPFFSRLLMFI
jgi:hypothetical protein